MLFGLASGQPPGLLFLVVSREGRVRAAPQEPTLTGDEPWQWCWEQAERDRALLAFAEACMRRRPVKEFRLSVRMGDRCEEYSADLSPLDSGDVLCLMRPVRDKRLTAAQRQVLDGVAAGKSNAAIAKRMAASESTVRSHLAAIRERLGVERVEQLVAAALGYD